MAVLVIGAVLLFAGVLCVIEIPRMLQQHLIRELWVFSLLLFLGVSLVILQSLGFQLPNPSDWVAWVYAPISNWLREIMQ